MIPVERHTQCMPVSVPFNWEHHPIARSPWVYGAQLCLDNVCVDIAEHELTDGSRRSHQADVRK